MNVGNERTLRFVSVEPQWEAIDLGKFQYKSALNQRTVSVAETARLISFNARSDKDSCCRLQVSNRKLTMKPKLRMVCGYLSHGDMYRADNRPNKKFN